MFGLSVYLSKITQYVEFDKRVRFLVGPRNDCLVLAQITDINVFLKSFFKFLFKKSGLIGYGQSSTEEVQLVAVCLLGPKPDPGDVSLSTEGPLVYSSGLALPPPPPDTADCKRC